MMKWDVSKDHGFSARRRSWRSRGRASGGKSVRRRRWRGTTQGPSQALPGTGERRLKFRVLIVILYHELSAKHYIGFHQSDEKIVFLIKLQVGRHVYSNCDAQVHWLILEGEGGGQVPGGAPHSGQEGDRAGETAQEGQNAFHLFLPTMNIINWYSQLKQGRLENL